MQRDLRDTALYRDAEALYRALRQPGTGRIIDAAELHVAPGGRRAVFSGSFMDALVGSPYTRICEIDLADAKVRVLTFGPNTDHSPRCSPDGRHVAFLSDRHSAGDLQLYLLDCESGTARRTPAVEGWVEYLHWSPDGRRILLGVAGQGADLASGQGAMASKRAADQMPSWAPSIAAGAQSFQWRRAWIYEIETDQVRPASNPDLNVWEAAWCGNHALAAIVSPGPGESLWYSASLHVIGSEDAVSREIYVARDQLGLPAASPSGKHLAVIEAICSDRGIIAGDLLLIDTTRQTRDRVDTHGIDVACFEWRSETRLLVAGHRGFETVVALYDVESGMLTESWHSDEVTTGRFYVGVSGIDAGPDCALIGESFDRAPEIAIIRKGKYTPVRSFDPGATKQMSVMSCAEKHRWSAPDGQSVEGWLLRPQARAPHPLVMSIHGGPVWHSRPRWLGRAGVPHMMLLARGYAVFLPNPRGSSGYGQEFARRVLGDVGGADARDCLSGIDHLVERGIADSNRLGVTGVSYGGFLTAWLITQDSRFAAAVPVAATTNYVTQHLVSNIPEWVRLFLADEYTNATGAYAQRSPILHAHRTKTPTLNVCGALDRCVPAVEAVQFHNALLENGVESVLATYPEEGHGIRKLPAAIDFAARMVGWFGRHMPAR